MDRFDIAEAKRTLEEANQQAPGQPATELMQRHMRLLIKAKSEQAKSPFPDAEDRKNSVSDRAEQAAELSHVGHAKRALENDAKPFTVTYNVADPVLPLPRINMAFGKERLKIHGVF